MNVFCCLHCLIFLLKFVHINACTGRSSCFRLAALLLKSEPQVTTASEQFWVQLIPGKGGKGEAIPFHKRTSVYVGGLAAWERDVHWHYKPCSWQLNFSLSLFLTSTTDVQLLCAYDLKTQQSEDSRLVRLCLKEKKMWWQLRNNEGNLHNSYI